MIPAWLIGCAVASFAFMLAVQVGVPALGTPGLLLTPFLAFWAGAAASTLSARRTKRDVLIIAIVVVGLLFLLLWQVQTRLGVQGGPNT